MTAAAAGIEQLFAYGTLMVPRIFAAVCGVALPASPARLSGYARYRVRGAVYPGLIRETAACTAGVLIGPIDATLWRRLDEFEGELYERLVVTVTTDDGRTQAAWTYLASACHQPNLTRQRWSLTAFERRHLDAYLARWT